MNDYYSIEDILSEDENVNVITHINATNMGWLDPNCNSNDLPKNSKITIPIWLAKSLKEKNMVSVEVPEFYFDKQILAAPQSINLKIKSNYFFEAGYKIYELTKRKALRINLIKIFSSIRFKRVVNHSLHFVCKNAINFWKHLTNLEKKLFCYGQEAAKDHLEFKNRKHVLLKCNINVNKKRKYYDL